MRRFGALLAAGLLAGTLAACGGTETQEMESAQALTFSAATDGAFDITLAPVSSAWGFTEDAYRVPGQEELDALLTHVGADHVHLEGGTSVSLDQGTQIDLGAIAKGYASDVVASIYQENGVAHGTVYLGGNTWVCGGNPEGDPWRIGVQDPARAEECLRRAAALEQKGTGDTPAPAEPRPKKKSFLSRLFGGK